MTCVPSVSNSQMSVYILLGILLQPHHSVLTWSSHTGNVVCYNGRLSRNTVDRCNLVSLKSPQEAWQMFGLAAASVFLLLLGKNK